MSFDQLDVVNLAPMQCLSRTYQHAGEASSSFETEGFDQFRRRSDGSASFHRVGAPGPSQESASTGVLAKVVDLQGQTGKTDEEKQRQKKRKKGRNKGKGTPAAGAAKDGPG